MSTWLNFLPIEIQDVETLIEPVDEIKEGETVAGAVSDGLKKLWSLFRATKKASDLAEVEIKYSATSDQERGKLFEQKSKARALEMLFWIGALDELKLWGHQEHYGLRVGWQVVEFKPPATLFPFTLFNPGGEQ